jgi:hypothetical protein
MFFQPMTAVPGPPDFSRAISELAPRTVTILRCVGSFAAVHQKRTQLLQLCSLKFTELAWSQAAEPQRSEGDALQCNDLVPNPRHQPSDFAVLAFPKLQLQHCTPPVSPRDANALKAEEPIGKVHSVAQLLQDRIVRDSSDLTAITAEDFKPGMCHALSEVAVVRDEKQAHRAFIKPADGEQPLVARRDKINGSRPAFRVAIRADNSRWFVDQKIPQPRPTQSL